MKNKISINKSVSLISQSEFDFLIKIIKSIKLDFNIITDINKVHSSFFYDTIQVNLKKGGADELSIFLNYSLHKDFFKKDIMVYKNFVTSQKASISPKIIKHGEMDGFAFLVYITKKSYAYKNLLTDNIPLVSYQLGHIYKYFYENFKYSKNKKLPTTSSCAKSFFYLSSFHKHDDSNKIDFFLKKYKKVDKKIFFSFYLDAWKYFREEVLINLSEKNPQICIGFKTPQDIIADSENYCPQLISNNSLYIGDRALDILFSCNLLNIDEEKFISAFKDLDDGTFERFKKTYDASWIIRMNFAYFNKLIKQFYSPDIHTISNMECENIYLENRARFKNHKYLDKYVESFNDFFIEK